MVGLPSMIHEVVRDIKLCVDTNGFGSTNQVMIDILYNTDTIRLVFSSLD